MVIISWCTQMSQIYISCKYIFFTKTCVQNNSICPKYKNSPMYGVMCLPFSLNSVVFQCTELCIYNLVWILLCKLALHIRTLVAEVGWWIAIYSATSKMWGFIKFEKMFFSNDTHNTQKGLKCIRTSHPVMCSYV
jgi:hypothetical protein